METVADSELALRISTAGEAIDALAEEELCRRFRPRIRHYGLRHLREEAAASDLVQEVLILTLKSLRAGRLRDPAGLASFVLGSCRLVVRNQQRTDQRRHALLERYPPPPPAAMEPVPPAADSQLVECLTRLSERERTVVILSYYAERSSQQVAEELGLSAGNVRVLRHRAIARLTACMSGPVAS